MPPCPRARIARQPLTGQAIRAHPGGTKCYTRPEPPRSQVQRVVCWPPHGETRGDISHFRPRGAALCGAADPPSSPANCGGLIEASARPRRARRPGRSSPADCGGLIEAARCTSGQAWRPSSSPANCGGLIEAMRTTAATDQGAISSPANCGGLIVGGGLRRPSSQRPGSRVAPAGSSHAQRGVSTGGRASRGRLSQPTPRRPSACNVFGPPGSRKSLICW